MPTVSDPGHGGFDPNSYGGFGVYPQGGGPADPPPRKKNRLGLIIGALAAVVIVSGVVAIYFLLVPGSPQASGPTPAPPVTTTQSSAPTTVEVTPVSVAPKIPGWQAVASRKGVLAYDVPPSWKVDRPGGLIGFGTSGSPDKVTMLDDAVFRPGFCQGRAGSTRAGAGLTSVGESDAGKAAAELARKTAIGAYTTADGTPPGIQATPPQPVTIGAQHGFQVTANLTVRPQGPCDSPRAVIVVTALPGSGGGTIALITWADQGTPDQADPADLHRISDSLRPAR